LDISEILSEEWASGFAISVTWRFTARNPITLTPRSGSILPFRELWRGPRWPCRGGPTGSLAAQHALPHAQSVFVLHDRAWAFPAALTHDDSDVPTLALHEGREVVPGHLTGQSRVDPELQRLVDQVVRVSRSFLRAPGPRPSGPFSRPWRRPATTNRAGCSWRASGDFRPSRRTRIGTESRR
jgi:hypothetical protein